MPEDASRRTTSSQRTGDDTARTSASMLEGRRSSARRPRWRRPARTALAPQRPQLRRKPLLGRLHQRAMERRTHGQRHDALRAKRLRPLARARHGRRAPRDDDLSRRVQVRRAHDVARGGFVAGLRDLVARRARASPPSRRADGHRVLHVAAAPPHDAHGVGERQRAGGDVRRVFAEAVTGDECGRMPRRLEQPRTPRC